MANSRVEQHVEKGNVDALLISSVACCQELWALIMDAGTGFSAQARLRSLRSCAALVELALLPTRMWLKARRAGVAQDRRPAAGGLQPGLQYEVPEFVRLSFLRTQAHCLLHCIFIHVVTCPVPAQLHDLSCQFLLVQQPRDRASWGDFGPATALNLHLIRRVNMHTGVRAQLPVSAQGVDHGEVGGGVLHHRHGGHQQRLLPRRHVQGHPLHAAVLQGMCPALMRIFLHHGSRWFFYDDFAELWTGCTDGRP